MGDAICGLQKLKYLSFRQAVLFPSRYAVADDPMNDAVFVKIAASCKSLQDLYLGHFLGITNATWKVCYNTTDYMYSDLHFSPSSIRRSRSTV